MVEMRRGPGRPAYDSKQKLVAAACSLLPERGFEATSPQVIQQRSGIGQGSMCHHCPGRGRRGWHWMRKVACGRAPSLSSTAHPHLAVPRSRRCVSTSSPRSTVCSIARQGHSTCCGSTDSGKTDRVSGEEPGLPVGVTGFDSGSGGCRFAAAMAAISGRQRMS